MTIGDYIAIFDTHFEKHNNLSPWQITSRLMEILTDLLASCDSGFSKHEGIAVHKTTIIEKGAIIKAPAIIGPKSFIGAHAYLRGGVFLGQEVTIGPGCEVKTSIVFDHSSLAHFNFVGDSIIGSNVNFEAGAVIANHYNERPDKQIRVLHQSRAIETGSTKFGALVGDNCKVGANAVLSPGTVLEKNKVVKRLELVEQVIE
ncbi:DapH/DapD/GlmU-related protein [Imperialibacter roseus]|uniref:DapH/DapD/GlmU-related protein n=1 Tax=Imperialibacter roseus TaxID=1324217 RepID=A0ABZ0IQ50_9BACT|nr:DapH/DapD/GlmU-related protein [Imperialibacter roseus]WOK07173.1 DapH/DapD/GlmU-related protein [Imperialibacter roseus]